MLKNRSYSGRIYFRGRYHAAAHPQLVEEQTLDAAQALLQERGADVGKRRSNPSDYLLAGLVHCQSCGSRYVGAAAHGRTRRYRYYTCFTRQRYGPTSCPADRLPADELERAIAEALLETLGRYDLIEAAAAKVMERAKTHGSAARQQLAAVEAEIRDVEDSLQRYFVAFERKRLSEEACAPGIESLSKRLRQLHATKAGLMGAQETEMRAPAPEELRALCARAEELIPGGEARMVKSLLQQLVAGVRVESRDSITPTFRVPASVVRILDGVVDPRGFEPLTF